MSLLLFLIVATPNEAPAILSAEEPDSLWTTEQVAASDEINLSALWALLENRPFDPKDTSKFVTVAKHKDGSTWAVFVPERLTELLSQIGDAEVVPLANRWKEMEVVKERNFYEPAFADNLAKLRRLAIDSRAKKKALLIMETV